MLSESEKDRFYQTLADTFGSESVSKRYAVRSSSCFEDAVSDSKAGAFRSVLDVPFD
ncbi:MAG: PEP/pyruvate-binding domain-containing protein [Patescibacteria group bacterium]